MPDNFSAAYALVFCAGIYFSGSLAWWLPLATLFLTDIAINVFRYESNAVGTFMIGNYLAYGAILLLGRQFRPSHHWLALLSGGILGAMLFYLITNTGSWLTDPEYPKTFSGWIQALTVGKPGYPHTWQFFRATLLSGGLFTGLFAGAMKLGAAAETEEEETESESEDGAAAEKADAAPQNT